MLAHDNVLASIETFHRIVPRMEHRLVSLLPLSHLLEQAVGLFYALSVGADILYVRSRNPRVIFDALRDHRVTSMVVVPQVLDLFWSAIEREVAKRGRETRVRPAFAAIARRLPMGIRPRLFGSVHKQLGGHFRLFLSAGAFLPPALQQAWEDLGVTVLQGYGATETGTGSSTRARRPRARDGRAAARRRRDADRRRRRDPVQRPDRLQAATGRTRPRRPRRSPTDGWYQTGDIGHLDDAGRLILSGRMKDIIVLPNGFNVYPEDIENALRIAGLRDSVVSRPQPGRIEAVVLGSAAGAPGAVTAADPAELRGRRRCGGQGRQRDARAEPADRRLAVLARRGLPADAHAQDQARAGPRLGRGGHALPVAESGRGPARRERPSSRPGSRPRASRARPGSPAPSRRSRPTATSCRRRRSSRPGG